MSRHPIGAYAVSTAPEFRDRDGKMTASNPHPTGWAAYDKTGLTWPVTAAEAATINAKGKPAAEPVEF